jgi:nitrile hydratase accessory protein
LSAPEVLADALPRLRVTDGQVFADPWQARAFALAVELSERGYFTWTEWTEALGNALGAVGGLGDRDYGSRYYECWLGALERLVTAKGLADRVALRNREAAWADAHEPTPHGNAHSIVSR